jgi:hypothetical protein
MAAKKHITKVKPVKTGTQTAAPAITGSECIPTK